MHVQGTGSSELLAPAAQSPALVVLETERAQTLVALARAEGSRAGVLVELKSASGQDAEQLQRGLRITEGQLASTKAKLAELDAQIARAKQSAPAAPGALLPPPPLPPEHRMFNLTKDEFLGATTFLFLCPLVLALTVRLLRRKTTPRVQGGIDTERFARLEQAVESVAIEVERIGESQRFQAKLMAEKQADHVARPT